MARLERDAIEAAAVVVELGSGDEGEPEGVEGRVDDDEVEDEVEDDGAFFPPFTSNTAPYPDAISMIH